MSIQSKRLITTTKLTIIRKHFSKKRAIEYLEFVLDYVSGALDGNSESVGNDGLKICPCCGGKSHYHIHDRIGIECDDCGLGLACVYETKEQAAEVWNRRNS